MAVFIGANKPKFQYGALKVKKMYKGTTQVYSSGNICTYYVDSGITYQEEVDEGASCLSPKTFTPAKSGWTFVGWRSDATTNSNVYTSYVMGDAPVTLYAVFRQTITVTYYNASASASAVNGYRYYNNGNIANASFALSQAALAGWTARGWSTSSAANGGITYADAATFTRDSNITLYGMYQQTIALTTVANGSTSAQYGTRYYNSNGNTINPAFTVSNPSKSGASFLGWSSDGTTSISNSTISNLTLSASTTRWAVFKYADATYHVSVTLVYPHQHSNEWSNPAKVALGSVPSIDTTKYGSVSFFTGGGGANANIVRIDNNYYYTYCSASLVIGGNNVTLGTAEKSGPPTDDSVTVDIRNKTYTLNLSINGTQTIYIQGYIGGGNGFCGGTIYIANNYESANNTSITFIGRTVVG